MALQYSATQSLTITAGSLASATARSSAPVTTSTSSNVTAILLEVSVLTTASATSGNKQVVVYGYKSVDGTTYDGGSASVDTLDLTGGSTNAVIGSPTNLVFLGTIQLNQTTTALTFTKTFEVSGPFGCIPPKWGIVLYNDCGTALGATVTAEYREAYYN